MGCQSSLTIRKCSGEVWPGVPATVSAMEQQAVNEQAFSTPILRTKCSASVPLMFGVQIGDSIEFGGLTWKIEWSMDVPAWRRTMLRMSTAALAGCEEVELRQWNRFYGCPQADQQELCSKVRAVIHHVESIKEVRNDAVTMVGRYRIFLEPSAAESLSVGHHIVRGSQVFTINTVQYLTEIGRVPYAEASSEE